jgi:hypothetical protein
LGGIGLIVVYKDSALQDGEEAMYKMHEPSNYCCKVLSEARIRSLSSINSICIDSIPKTNHPCNLLEFVLFQKLEDL